MMDQSLIAQAAQLLKNAHHVAVFTGAGVSAESGIATFRDAQTGLWSKFDPQKLASEEGFLSDPGLVWRWYMERLHGVQQKAQPNPGHWAIAQLERLLPRLTLITQNVDNLHERAGSNNVIHLHGSITRFRCHECHAEHALQPGDQSASMPPLCAYCSNWVRPDVVWFGEMLPTDAVDAAWQAAHECDVMLVVGTSGIVYPAAQLPWAVHEGGGTIIDVNPDFGVIAGYADLFLQGAGGKILPQIVQLIESASDNAPANCAPVAPSGAGHESR